MKVFFIITSLYIVYLMKFKYKATYDADLDTFRIEYLLVGSAALGAMSTYVYTPLEVSYVAYFFEDVFLKKQQIKFRYYGLFQSG